MSSVASKGGRPNDRGVMNYHAPTGIKGQTSGPGLGTEAHKSGSQGMTDGRCSTSGKVGLGGTNHGCCGTQGKY